MRICSLLPSGTEILFAMGLGEQVVGVSDLCDYPPECTTKTVVCRSKVDASVLSSDQVEQEMQRLLAAGESPFELDNEWLLEHPPDVVLTQDLCYFCDISAEQVKDAVTSVADPPRLIVMQPKTLEDVFYSILEVGEACEAVLQARSLEGCLRDRVESISQTLRVASQRPKVFSLEGINPLVIRRSLDTGSTNPGSHLPGFVPSGLSGGTAPVAGYLCLGSGETIYRLVFFRPNPWPP